MSADALKLAREALKDIAYLTKHMSMPSACVGQVAARAHMALASLAALDALPAQAEPAELDALPDAEMMEVNPYLDLGPLDPHGGRQVLEWYSAAQMRAYAAQEVAAERERCASVCDDEARIRTEAGNTHPEDSDSRGRCFAGARAAANCARGIRSGEVVTPLKPSHAVLQGGLTNEQLNSAWRQALPSVEPTERDLTAFALGVECGASLRHRWQVVTWSSKTDRTFDTRDQALDYITMNDSAGDWHLRPVSELRASTP